MQKAYEMLKNSTIHSLFHSYSPASRAVILFALPFTIVDAVHYYTAGAALIFSLPILLLIYLLCGALAAKFARASEPETLDLARTGRTAGVRLWLTSTIINTLLAVILGVASLGYTFLSGGVYVCLFAPLHALGSALTGWLGGWVYQQYLTRTDT